VWLLPQAHTLQLCRVERHVQLLLLLLLVDRLLLEAAAVLHSCQAGICSFGDVPLALKVLLQRLQGVARHLAQPTEVWAQLLLRLLLLLHAAHGVGLLQDCTHPRVQPSGRWWRRLLLQHLPLLLLAVVC
jgi:hypothetical protein